MRDAGWYLRPGPGMQTYDGGSFGTGYTMNDEIVAPDGRVRSIGINTLADIHSASLATKPAGIPPANPRTA